MGKWKKETHKLKKDHSWKASAGYNIFVANRGAVSFSVPENWVLKPDSESMKFFDAEPPDDNIRLELSFNRLPPANWTNFPLQNLIQTVIADEEREIISQSEVTSVERTDLRIVWLEFRFKDPTENRDAFSRILIGLGGNIQCLITLDFWPDDTERAKAVWAEVVATLTLGAFILDPTTGTQINPRLN